MKPPNKNYLKYYSYTPCSLIDVEYRHTFRCKICGYTPPDFGMIPKLSDHMLIKHNIGISRPWMDAYSDGDIKKRLPHLNIYDYRLEYRFMWE